MRQRERRNRKNHKATKHYTKHLPRLIHFEKGEVWSWRINKRRNGVIVRDPRGKNRSIHGDVFRARVKWSLEDYCCEWCCPAWGGPGFKPRVVKRYIQVVFKEGRTWDRVAEWKRLGLSFTRLDLPELREPEPKPPVHDPYHWDKELAMLGV